MINDDPSTARSFFHPLVVFAINRTRVDLMLRFA